MGMNSSRINSPGIPVFKHCIRTLIMYSGFYIDKFQAVHLEKPCSWYFIDQDSGQNNYTSLS